MEGKWSSYSASELYINNRSSLLEEKEQAECLLSLATPDQNSKAFDFIHVPLGKTSTSCYQVQELKNYLKTSFKDPMRVHRSLSFMLTRIHRIISLPGWLKQFSLQEVNDKFKEKILTGILEDWITGRSSKYTFLPGILCGIEQLIQYGCTTTYDKDQATILLATQPKGTWLIRPSNQGQKDGSSEVTIFTISYQSVLQEGVFHRRYVDVHGVGVYCPPLDIDLNIFKEGKIIEILKLLYYRPPPFACVLDAIEEMIDIDELDPSKLICERTIKNDLFSKDM